MGSLASTVDMRITPQGSAPSPVPKGWRAAWNKQRDKGLVGCKPKLGQATPSAPSLHPRPTSRTPRLQARATRSPSVLRSSSSSSRRSLHREPHTAFAQRATMRATGLPSGTTKRDLDPTRLSIGPADFRLIEGEQPLRPACRDIQRGCSSKPRNTPRPISTRRRVSARRYNPKTSFPGRLTPFCNCGPPHPHAA